MSYFKEIQFLLANGYAGGTYQTFKYENNDSQSLSLCIHYFSNFYTLVIIIIEKTYHKKDCSVLEHQTVIQIAMSPSRGSAMLENNSPIAGKAQGWVIFCL